MINSIHKNLPPHTFLQVFRTTIQHGSDQNNGKQRKKAHNYGEIHSCWDLRAFHI